ARLWIGPEWRGHAESDDCYVEPAGAHDPTSIRRGTALRVSKSRRAVANDQLSHRPHRARTSEKDSQEHPSLLDRWTAIRGCVQDADENGQRVYRHGVDQLPLVFRDSRERVRRNFARG